MATYTTNYNLKKPALDDFVDVADLNGNMDLVDQGMQANRHYTTTVTLPAASWDNLAQTASVSHVTSTTTVFVSPDADSADDWDDCGVTATSQGAGTLTFTCAEAPTGDLTANIVILGV